MVSELLSRGSRSGQQSWRAIVRREEPGRNGKPGTRPRVYREQQQPVLRAYVTYYERSRTHLALGKDTPEARASIRPAWGESWRGPKSAASTIATNGKALESPLRWDPGRGSR